MPRELFQVGMLLTSPRGSGIDRLHATPASMRARNEVATSAMRQCATPLALTTKGATPRPIKATQNSVARRRSQPEGSVYVKTTPMVRPAAALATARTPARDNVTPVGKGGPLAEMPNAPPLTIPTGSVVAKSKVLLPVKVGSTTFHADEDAGAGLGVVGAGPGARGRELVSSLPPHPATRAAQLKRLNFKASRRLN